MAVTTHTPCPYGPEYQVYWNMRYRLLSRFDQARVDATGLYTMVPESHALDMAQRGSGSRVLDVCSGVGAMSIAFARAGKRVTAVEIDAGRVEMARHNARVYGVSELIDFRLGDITAKETLDALPGDSDTLFFDPPWGQGPGDYLRRPITRLQDLRLAGRDPRLLAGAIACREVMMRLPPNFDIGIFRDTPGEKIAYVTTNGYLHWYFVRLLRDEFLAIPDRSAEGLSLEEARAGFSARLLGN